MRMNCRSFVTTATTSLAALAMSAATGTEAEAQLVYTKADWRLSEFNELARNPAWVKQVFDIIPIAEGRFLHNIKNSLNGLHFGFGIPDQQIKVVAALHGPANMLNYDDVIWSKYQIGAWLKVTDPSTGQPAVRNPYYASKAGTALRYSTEDPDNGDSLYQDTSIQPLQQSGVEVQFAPRDRTQDLP